MKRSVRDKWTTDLRSGGYRQGFGSFERTIINDDNVETTVNCCLGVLCHSAGIPLQNKPGNDNYVGGRGFVGVNDLLGGEIWSDKLWNLNDASRFSFDMIADWIEKNIPVED